MFTFDKAEIRTLRRLDTPAKIQDFLEDLPINFEKHGETCYSPRLVLRHGRAHCLEAALLAAASLRLQGRKPLVVDLQARRPDFDHAIAVFKIDGHWGAISKSNHLSLRYRDPIYKNIRELVMSYFNEYFLDNGRKTLRSFSNPVDLSRFDKRNWMTSEQEVWYIDAYLNKVRHIPILTKKMRENLRKADELQIRAGKLTQWKK